MEELLAGLVVALALAWVVWRASRKQPVGRCGSPCGECGSGPSCDDGKGPLVKIGGRDR